MLRVLYLAATAFRTLVHPGGCKREGYLVVGDRSNAPAPGSGIITSLSLLSVVIMSEKARRSACSSNW